MSPTRKLHDLGQSIWLDNISRDLLTSGTLRSYIDTLTVTGLTSNPSIFHKAIADSHSYDDAIDKSIAAGNTEEETFFSVALEDIKAAADLFRPAHEASNGVDGWVSLEVSPLLALDATSTVTEATQLWARADRPNVFIKIPGTNEGLSAIEESIFAGIPVNVTLLFSAEQYQAAANAYYKGIERRIAAGLSADVASVASVFISRWDVAVFDEVPKELRNTLGIAVGQQCYTAYCDVASSDRCRRIMNAGGRPQRLLFASTGTKDPNASDLLYVESLAAPLTINTMPESTLKAFADHGKADKSLKQATSDSESVITAHTKAGIDIAALASKLQNEGAKSFVKSWNELMAVIAVRK